MNLKKTNQLIKSLEDCIRSADALKARSDQLVERINSGNLGSDFFEKVNEFLSEFEKVREVFDRLPLENGRPTVETTESERRAALDLFPKLISRVEDLYAAQELIISTVQKNLQADSEKLELIRKAKNIFNKFIKKPEDPTPKFFDRKG